MCQSPRIVAPAAAAAAAYHADETGGFLLRFINLLHNDQGTRQRQGPRLKHKRPPAHNNHA